MIGEEERTMGMFLVANLSLWLKGKKEEEEEEEERNRFLK